MGCSASKCSAYVSPDDDEDDLSDGYSKEFLMTPKGRIARLSIIPPETAAGCKKFMDQDYHGIRLECKAKGKLFEDPTFPPEGRSLFFNGRQPAAVQWLRPGVGDTIT